MTAGVRIRGTHVPLSAAVGMTALATILSLGFLVPVVSPYGITAFVADPFLPPSLTHPFGTDQYGRDLFTRTFAAAPLDLGLALIGVVVPAVIGTLIGAVLGTTRILAVDTIINGLIEGINAFPGLVLMIAIIAIVGTGVQGIIIATILTGWAHYARVARARALVVRDAEYVQVTKLLGYSRATVLVRHIMPNVYQETASLALTSFVLVILGVAGLSFLGLGIQPPTPEWGTMLSEARFFLTQAPWMSIIPGAVLSITAVSISLIALAVSQADG